MAKLESTMGIPRMTVSRPLLLLAAALATAAVASAASATPAHQGVAFSTVSGAKARLVEPDGRVVAVDDGSDLVSDASIAERRAKAAIARLIRTAADKAAKGSPAAAPVLPKLPEP